MLFFNKAYRHKKGHFNKLIQYKPVYKSCTGGNIMRMCGTLIKAELNSHPTRPPLP